MPEATPVQSSQQEICARRGSRWLSRDDLQAHLAASIRLENIGLLLGAGASSGGVGGKSMSQIWSAFAASYAQSYKWLVKERFVVEWETPNV